MRYAIIEEATGAVVNLIEWDGESAFDPGAGFSLREDAADDVISRWNDIDAARIDLAAENEACATSLRVAVAGTHEATKLAVYREKYGAALAAISGDAAARAMLADEAAARGQSVDDFAALVKTLGERWIAAGLAIDAIYQTNKAAIAALDLAGAQAFDVREAYAALPF